MAANEGSSVTGTGGHPATDQTAVGVDQAVAQVLDQFHQEQPLHYLTLLTSRQDQNAPLSRKEKMLHAYICNSMEDAIKAFPQLYDLYAKKATAFTQAFAANPDDMAVVNEKMRSFEGFAIKAIANEMQYVHATQGDIKALIAMQQSRTTAFLRQFYAEADTQIVSVQDCGLSVEPK